MYGLPRRPGANRRSLVLVLILLSVAWATVADSAAPETAFPTVKPSGVSLTSTGGTPRGYTPAQIRHAYGVDRVSEDGTGQIIGIVSAYDSPSVAGDVATFIQTFGLPSMHGLPGTSPCTVRDGPHPCFQRLYLGSKPSYQDDWVTETCLGVEWAHAIAPGADILLVEAAQGEFADLLPAVDRVVDGGARVVAMSWGSLEFADELAFDEHFKRPGITFVASAGDAGNGVTYPASSPYVVAVGGTSLRLDGQGAVVAEDAWVGSGGGVSAYEPEPAYQTRYGLPKTDGRRALPDVAYSADAHFGFPVYNSASHYGRGGWFRLGGTSAGVPQWAAIVALANQRRGGQTLSSADLASSPLYRAAGANDYRQNFRDVVSGINGDCNRCRAGAGYDFVTGLGAPRVDHLVPFLASNDH
jgi:subtilase family serine protease